MGVLGSKAGYTCRQAGRQARSNALSTHNCASRLVPAAKVKCSHAIAAGQ